MAGITGAGSGSGLPLEDIIASTLSARRAQFEQQIVRRESSAKTNISGLGQLKSAISEFNTAMKKLYEPGAFNKRTVNISQPEDNPVLKVTSKSGTSNGQYNILVNQLAQGSRLESVAGSFSSVDQEIATSDGKLTFSAGDKSFEVEVKAGDTLQGLRKRINQNSENFGVTANLINVNGETRMVLESTVTGVGNDLSITADTAELKVFDTGDASSKLNQTKAADDASIDIDGVTVTSATNDFNDVVQDLDISILREADLDAQGDKTANKVSISSDTSAVTELVNQFIKSYNTLLDKMDALGKRPTIVAGERQNDGGALSGDSTLRSIESFMFSTISTPVEGSTTFPTVFDMGIKMDNKGRLSLDSAKFDEVSNGNFEQISTMFGGDDGLAKQLQGQMELYSRTGGDIAKRTDVFNQQLRDISDQRSRFEENMASYESSLRRQYGNLDALIVNMNQSASSMLSLLNNSNNSGF